MKKKTSNNRGTIFNWLQRSDMFAEDYKTERCIR